MFKKRKDKSSFRLFNRKNQHKSTKVRRESNKWLRQHVLDIKGHVLSIGSGNDKDKEGRKYRDYFKHCSSYTTSEITPEFKCDMILDVRSMHKIEDNSYDCVFCSGVLEHVDDFFAGLKEISRVLKHGGILLLGLPFRQSIHEEANDYWRFTEYGIRYMLKNNYEIINLTPICNYEPKFPVTYFVKAKKL